MADRRWTREYKRLIVNSRVDSTFQVVEAIRRAASPPRVLVNASATGWYGDVGDRETGLPLCQTNPDDSPPRRT